MMVAGLAVVMPTQALDVNTASIAQLEGLRGVGPRTAKMIVNERSRAGAFASLEDLSDRVRGLGERRVRALSQAGLEVRPAQVKGALETDLQHTVAKAPDRRSKPPVAKPEIISPQSF
jgi:competence protein ComEA